MERDAGSAQPGESTLALARFVSDLTVGKIPSPVLRHAELCILDTLGCGLFGSTLPWSKSLSQVVRELDGDVAATVWGNSARQGVAEAALCNGAAVHAFEFDDLHRESIVHLGSVVLPAALAVSELLGDVSGARLLVAVVAGYEVGARVGMAVGASHLLQGWHPTGTHGTFAAAAACASLLGLSAEQTVHAIGLAGSQASGLMSAQYGAMAKRFHAGRAAQGGVYAALLARGGYTGAVDVLEAPYGGYWSTLADEVRPQLALTGLGTNWETRRVSFKFYPANGSCHPAIEILLRARDRLAASPEEIKSVSVRCSTATAEHVGWPYVPDSVTTAQMNLSYIAAATLADGELTASQFAQARLADPTLLGLAGRVRVEADAALDAAGPDYRHFTDIEVVTTDGRRFRDSQQFASTPVADDMAEAVQSKFRRLAGTALPAEDLGFLVQLVARLEGMADVRELISSLAPRTEV